jgi:hypothetical protein
LVIGDFLEAGGAKAGGLRGAEDVFVSHDAIPFGLSLSKPFDKLRANGSKLPVMIFGVLNNCGR